MITKITKQIKINTPILTNITLYITSDNNEYQNQQSALQHQQLIDTYPNLNKSTILFIENIETNEDYNNLLNLINSNTNVIILIDHSGNTNQQFYTIEPSLAAVTAVIKILHRRSIGCNYNEYVRGIIYKQESLSFDDNNSSYSTGRNIKQVLN